MRTILPAILLLSSVLTMHLQAQPLLTAAVTQQVCNQGCTGEVQLVIDATQFEPEWMLPFELDYIHQETGEVTFMTINSLTHTLTDLCSGEYEIVLDLDESCEFTLIIEVGAATPAPSLSPPYSTAVLVVHQTASSR